MNNSPRGSPQDNNRSTNEPVPGSSGMSRFSRLFSPGFSSTANFSNTPASGQPATRIRQSPYSPFPFGSPLTFSRRSVLNPASPNSGISGAGDQTGNEEKPAESSSILSRVRARGRDLYSGNNIHKGLRKLFDFNLFHFAGRVMFGGTNNSSITSGLNLRRHNRLLASGPYQSSLSNRGPKKHSQAPSGASGQPGQKQDSNPATSEPNKSADSSSSTLSSTARVILRTLERMSTPIQDALKIPLPRAEKRRALAEELLERGSLLGSPGSSSTRRRPRLGQAEANKSPAKGSGFLNGPPLRTQVCESMSNAENFVMKCGFTDF